MMEGKKIFIIAIKMYIVHPLNMPANLENSAVATGLEKVSFLSNPKERQCQIMLELPHNCTHLSSVQFSHSVVSNSLQPHESQHARPLCPSPTPRVYSNSCLLSPWCHPTISSSIVPFSSYSIFTSIRVSSNESALGIRWPKYWSFSFSIIPSKEHPGLKISAV